MLDRLHTHIPNRSSLIIDQLFAQAAEPGAPKIGIACVYCDYRDQENQNACNILGSIVKQLLKRVTKWEDSINYSLMQFQTVGRDEKALTKLLYTALDKHFKYTFICIDALDELKEEARNLTLKWLKVLLTQKTGTRLFLTGRPHVREQLERGLTIVGGGAIQSIEIKASHEDIQQFINYKIDRDDNPGAMNDKLRAEIRETIMSRSEGM